MALDLPLNRKVVANHASESICVLRDDSDISLERQASIRLDSILAPIAYDCFADHKDPSCLQKDE